MTIQSRFGLLPVILVASCGSVFAQWMMQESGTKARLRGISAVNARVAWASGTQGTFVRTVDGGRTWQAGTVAGAETLDFRDIEAFDANTAYLLSIGEGEKSRIYKTIDGGRSWQLQFTNRNPKAFFDAMAFWDSRRGITFSDPVDGRFIIFRTSDGGATWDQVPAESIPPAIQGEAAFAASGTCITVQGRNNVWIATGGGAARVYRSADGGETWQVAPAPIGSGPASAGIFSIAFKDPMNGVVVGGDYTKEGESRDNVAVTSDGGRSWRLVRGPLPGGYRSGVAFVRETKSQTLIAVGPAGTDRSVDLGESWARFDSEGFDTISFAGPNIGWASGAGGRIAKYIR